MISTRWKVLSAAKRRRIVVASLTVVAGAIMFLVAVAGANGPAVLGGLVLLAAGAVVGIASARRKVMSRFRRRMLWSTCAGGLMIAAIASQIAIPAAQTALIRSQLGRIATVRQLDISYPFPAFMALSGHINNADAHLGSLNVKKLSSGSSSAEGTGAQGGPRGGASMFSKLGNRITNATVRVDEINNGSSLTLARNLYLQKRASRLRLKVAVSASALAPVIGGALGLPPGSGVSLTASGGDLMVTGSSSQLGGTFTLTVFVSNGALDSQIKLSPSAAAQLGVPATPPPQPLVHSKSLAFDTLAVTQRGGTLLLDASGHLSA